MNDEEFVSLIELYVRDAAVLSTLKNLERPPGQKPLADLVKASDWFKKQDEHAKEIVQWIIRRAADHAAVGFLCVIDGAKAIEDPPDKGHFELYYVRGEARVYLNDPNTSTLNEIFR